MFNTPTDCYNYIIENDLEMPVLGAMMNHVGGYSIAEIADGRFHNRDGAVSFSSPGYKINIPVTDDEIDSAVKDYAVEHNLELNSKEIEKLEAKLSTLYSRQEHIEEVIKAEVDND